MNGSRPRSAPLKIVRIIARLNVGGPARHVTLLNEALQARGHQTLLVHGALDADEATLEHLARDSGIPVIRNRHLKRSVSLLADARTLVELVATIFRESPDVVHTHTSKAGVLGRLAAVAFNVTRARSRRCLVVHTYHGHVLEGYFSPTITRAIRLTERALAAVTDRIVSVSRAQREDIVERLRIATAEQTTTVHLGLRLGPLLSLSAQAPDLRSTLSIPRGDIVVGYVGRIVPVKDLPTLVRALAIARRQNPKLRLLVAGGGTSRSEIERLADELQVGKHLHMAGWIHDLERLYATIDICALSSINEGTPVALIEGMAAGRPAVATAVGGVPDVVEHEVTGLLVPPRSAEALAAALVRLAADAPERARMGEESRRRAAERYSVDRLVSEIEDLYVKGLARKRGRALG